MHKQATLILVADGAHARLIKHGTRNDKLLFRMSSRAAMKRDIDLVTDRPGRAFDRKGAGRHAMEPRTSAHRTAQKAFARRVGACVDKALAQGKFDKFLVVAPARTLGDLRKAFSEQARACVSEEITKDLAALPTRDVLRRVAADHLI